MRTSRFSNEQIVQALRQADTGTPVSIMAPSSRPRRSKRGPAIAACSSTSPGQANPKTNSHIESFNGRLRDECLDVHQFLSIRDARVKIEAWRTDYNHYRPHGSVGDLIPAEFAEERQEQRTAKASVFLTTDCLETGPASPSCEIGKSLRPLAPCGSKSNGLISALLTHG